MSPTHKNHEPNGSERLKKSTSCDFQQTLVLVWLYLVLMHQWPGNTLPMIKLAV